MTVAELQRLEQEPLAFSSEEALKEKLRPATKRLPFVSSHNGATLNVEFFDGGSNDGKKSNNINPVILYIHGVCASCETLGIQALVTSAKEHGVSVAVLELEGHGLSSGEYPCDDFDRLRLQTLEFVQHTLTEISSSAQEGNDCKNISIPYFIGGNSLGGVLAIYTANSIAKQKNTIPGNLLGLVPIAPAVGVRSEAIPSPIIIQALKVLAYLAPSSKVPLTPLEDPASYNCPSNSKRNYSGHWPLGTSKMLLDVTTVRVLEDLARTDDSDSNEQRLDLCLVPSLLLIAGEDDDTVPCESVSDFFQKVQPVEKRLMTLPKAGHDLLSHKSFSTQVFCEMFQWVEMLLTRTTVDVEK